ncbi:MAG: glycoside hydrolase family 3 N-terminal domain-containing protein [Acidimicrobiales bacterium]
MISRQVALWLLALVVVSTLALSYRASLDDGPASLAESVDTTTSTTTSTTTTSTTSTTTSTTTTTIAPKECLAPWPIEHKVGQLIMALALPSSLDSAADLAETGQLGAVGLLGEPGPALPDQLAEIQKRSWLPVTIAVDEEGGNVQRLVGLLNRLPSARSVADLGDPTFAEFNGVVHGSAMFDLGITMDLAPVLDVGGGPGIGSRSYSSDPAIVSDFGLAFASGLVESGVTPVVKHFPGHGQASADSHRSLPITPSIEDLRQRDLLPFLDAIEIPGVALMVGHLNVPGLTDGLPATLSPAAIDGLLRTELGFDGLVMTDALNMGAIRNGWTTPEAAVLAVAAGADVVMVGSVSEVAATHGALLSALEEGTISLERVDESVLRVLASKSIDPCELTLA